MPRYALPSGSIVNVPEDVAASIGGAVAVTEDEAAADKAKGAKPRADARNGAGRRRAARSTSDPE